MWCDKLNRGAKSLNQVASCSRPRNVFRACLGILRSIGKIFLVLYLSSAWKVTSSWSVADIQSWCASKHSGHDDSLDAKLSDSPSIEKKRDEEGNEKAGDKTDQSNWSR